MQFIKNDKLRDRICRAIRCEQVSVYKIADGKVPTITNYSIMASDGTTYDFEQCLMYSDDDINIYEYSICIDGNQVASTIISNQEKVIPQPAMAILKLFQQCSCKVLYQEMQNAIHDIQTPNHFRTKN